MLIVVNEIRRGVVLRGRERKLWKTSPKVDSIWSLSLSLLEDWLSWIQSLQGLITIGINCHDEGYLILCLDCGHHSYFGTAEGRDEIRPNRKNRLDRTDPELGLVSLRPNFIGPNVFGSVPIQEFFTPDQNEWK